MDKNQSIDHQMTSEIGKQVFTTNGVYVGTVRDITLDVDGEKATQLAVNDINDELFDNLPQGRGVLIPYRWVRATNDVVLVADIVERIEPADSQPKSIRGVTEATQDTDSASSSADPAENAD